MVSRFVTSSLDQVIGALGEITEAEIGDFVHFVKQSGEVLFAQHPTWYMTMLLAPNGLQALSKLPESILQDLFMSKNVARRQEALMMLCLRVQSSLRPPNKSTDLNILVSWILSGICPISSLYASIAHYIHPNQSQTLAQLSHQLSQLPRLPHNHLPCSRTRIYQAPPQSLPSLFPNLDTTQISPQYDWFMHLLSKYTPATNAMYEDQLQFYLQQLTGRLSIPNTFVHNSLFNSYDEYLRFKLPQLGYPTDDIPSSTFSYFPNQHPFLTTFTAQDEHLELTSTVQYPTHYVWSFLLGTTLLAQHPPDFYEDLNYEEFIDQFHPIGLNQCINTPSLEFQLIAYKYRAYLLTIDSQHFRHHLSLQSQPDPTNPHLVLRDTPTTFTNPYFPLKLSLLGTWGMSLQSISEILSTSWIKKSCVIEALMNQQSSANSVMYHIFSQHFPEELDSHLISTIRGLSRELKEYTIQTWVHPNRIYLNNLCNSFTHNFVQRSYELYLEGRDTLHQLLYHHMILYDPTKCPTYDCFRSILIFPFLHYLPEDVSIQKHIMLSVHAGFLNSLPLTQSLFTTTETGRVSDLQTHLAAALPLVYRALIPFRAFIHCFLLKIVNFEVYFEPQTNAVLDVIPTISASNDFNPSQIQHFGCIPPIFIGSSRTLDYVQNPIKSNPNVTYSLIDPNGEILALEYKPDGRPIGFGVKPKHEWVDRNPFLVKELFKSSELFFESSPHFPPLLTATQGELILSPNNQINIKSTPTIILRNQYAQYRRELGGIERNLVSEQIHKVLLFVDVAGLTSRQSSPTASSLPSYPFPSPIPTPDELTTQHARQLSTWGLEMLIVISFNIQRFQPLRRSTLPSSPDLTTANATSPPVLYEDFIKTRSAPNSQANYDIPRNHILSTYFSTFPHLLHYTPYHLEPRQIKLVEMFPSLTTKHSYLFDALLHAVLSPSLKLIQTLESFAPNSAHGE